MKTYFVSAFSATMLKNQENIIKFTPITEEELCIENSCIGHQATADVFEVPMNRASLTNLKAGTVLYLAQLNFGRKSGRLAEGLVLDEVCKSDFDFWKIEIQ